MNDVKPLVLKKGGKQRLGRGFSLGELKEVKLSLKQALKLGVPVDSRRRTVHENNIRVLKDFLASLFGKTSESADKIKGKAKSVRKKSSK